MAVLEPTSTAWVVLASYASNAFPIGVLAVLQLDTGVEWSGTERLKFFAPPMALNLACIVVFALAWPRAGVGPPVANPGTGFLRRASRGLATGIRRLDREEGRKSIDGSSDEVSW